MTLVRSLTLGLFAALVLGACAQELGDVCQNYPGMGGASDCATGLECCGDAFTCAGGTRGRGICVQAGTCEDTIECDVDAGLVDGGDGDAGDGDAGDGDAGDGDAGLDAGSDSGTSDSGVDAGSDAGPTDAGSDAGATDAGTDSGPTDAS